MTQAADRTTAPASESAVAPEQVGISPGRRRLVGMTVLVVLLILVLNVTGVQIGLPDAWPSLFRSEPPLPAVRATSIQTIARFERISSGGISPYMAVGADGTLGITDRMRQVVMRYSQTGQLVSTWGPQLSPDTTIGEIGGIAASGGQWYVLDRAGARVIRLDANGRPVGTIALNAQSPYGPNGLAFDAAGNLYVTDTGWNRILAYGPDGRFVRAIGSAGDRPGEFKQPMGIAFGPDGSAFVADWENSRMQRLDRNFAAAGAWSTATKPWGSAIDPSGRVYVPDASQNVVLVFSPGGEKLAEIGGAGSTPIDLQGASQVVLTTSGSTMFVLGQDGLARVELESLPGPPPSASGPDVGGLLFAALLFVLGLVIGYVAGRCGSFSPRRWLGGGRAPRYPAVPPPGPAPAPSHGPPDVPAQEPPPAEPAPLPTASEVARPPAPEPVSPSAPPTAMPAFDGQTTAFTWQSPLAAVAAPRLSFETPRSGIGLAAIPAAVANRMWLGVAAGVLLAAVGEILLLGTASLSRSLTLLVGGAILFAVSAQLAPSTAATAWLLTFRPRASDLSVPKRGTVLILGVAGLLAAAALATWLSGGFRTGSANVGAILWLAAIAAAVVALIRSRRRDSAPDAAGSGDRRRFLLALAAVFLVGLAVRLVSLDTAPPALWFDEAETGLEARRVWSGDPFEPLSHDHGRDPSAYFYLVGASVQTLGGSDPIFAVRLVPAVLGALGVFAVGLLGRELFGWQVGLAAAGLLTVDRWHVDFSRIAMANITAPLAATLALWLLARAVRRGGGWTDLGLAGLALGIGLHGYVGFAPAIGVALASVLLAGIVQRWPLRRLGTGLAVYLCTATLVALPVLVFAARSPAEYTARANEVSILSDPNATTATKLSKFGENLSRHLLMFNVQGRGDTNGRHNLPGAPMLDPVSGVLLVLGLAWCLLKVREWRYALLGLWAALGLAGGLLTIEAPQGARTIVESPVLALLAAVGLVLAADRLRPALTTLDGAWRDRPRWAARLEWQVPAVAAGLAVAWAGASSLDTYFNHQMRSDAVWAAFSPLETIVGMEARALSGSSRILVSETLLSQPTIAYLAPEARPQPFDPASDLPLPGDANTVIFLNDRDKALWQEVSRVYPGASVKLFDTPSGGGPALAETEVTPETIEAGRGVDATFTPASGAPVRQRVASLDLNWSSSTPTPFQAELTGRLSVPGTGDYGFDVPDGFSLDIGGTTVQGSGGPLLHLARGSYDFRLVGTAAEPSRLQVLWRTPTDPQARPIPPELLSAGLPSGTGLRGAIYNGPTWSGAPVEERVDPVVAIYFHLLAVPRPRTMEWTGELQVPQTGDYRLAVEQVSQSTIWLDDKQVLTNEGRGQHRDVQLHLEAGRHPIRVRLYDADGGSHIYLTWTPPGGQEQAIPSQFLYPPPPTTAG